MQILYSYMSNLCLYACILVCILICILENGFDISFKYSKKLISGLKTCLRQLKLPTKSK